MDFLWAEENRVRNDFNNIKVNKLNLKNCERFIEMPFWLDFFFFRVDFHYLVLLFNHGNDFDVRQQEVACWLLLSLIILLDKN